MADTKITDMTGDASPTIDDLIVTVNDPGGSPGNRKVTLQNALKLAPCWVSRTSNSGWDAVVGSLTTDGNFNDLDLSSIVPSGAKIIELRLQMNAPTAGWSISLRENGTTPTSAPAVPTIQVSGVSLDVQVMVPCDSGRVIEYKATSGSWNAINIVVTGWYIDTIN